mgnify:CR=1 FL=1
MTVRQQVQALMRWLSDADGPVAPGWASPAFAALGWPAVRSVALSATYPGGEVRSLGQASPAPGGVWEAVVGLERGCAMVRVVMSA